MRGDAGYPVRVAFTKHGKVRFISHRDVARAFERAFRIETLPLAFTQGFSPRPKVSFGLALSVGHESEAEYLDVELTTPIPLAALAARLTRALPEGIDVIAVIPLADRAPALQEAVSAVDWEIEVLGGPDVDATAEAITARIDDMLRATTFPVSRVRKGKETTDDIRPAIVRLTVLRSTAGGTLIGAELATRPTSVRPAELVAALGSGLQEGRVRRIRQWIDRDGERHDPLTIDARIALEARGVMREGIDVRRNDRDLTGPRAPAAGHPTARTHRRS